MLHRFEVVHFSFGCAPHELGHTIIVHPVAVVIGRAVARMIELPQYRFPGMIRSDKEIIAVVGVRKTRGAAVFGNKSIVVGKYSGWIRSSGLDGSTPRNIVNEVANKVHWSAKHWLGAQAVMGRIESAILIHAVSYTHLTLPTKA